MTEPNDVASQSISDLLTAARTAKAEGQAEVAHEALTQFFAKFSASDSPTQGLEASYELETLGHSSEALKTLRTLATLFPDNSEVLSRLAGYLHKIGQSAEAASYQDWVLELQGDAASATAHILYSNMIKSMGRANKAISVLRDLTIKFPDDPVVLGRLAWLLHEAGDSAAGAEYQKKVLEIQGDAAPDVAHIIHVNMLNAVGSPEQLLPAVRGLAQRFPDSPDALARAAWLLHQSGYSAEAVAHQERVLALRGDAASSSERNIYANMLSAIGDKQGAIEALQRLVENDADDPAVLGRLAWLMHESGDSENALVHQERTIALQGAAAPVAAHIIHANMYNAIGRSDESVAVLRDLAERVPDDLEVQQLLAERCLDNHDFDEGIRLLSALNARSQGEDIRTVLLLARALRSAGRLEEEVEIVLGSLKTLSSEFRLLRYIFTTYPRMGTAAEVNEGLKLVRTRLGQEQGDDLEALMLLQTMQFSKALPVLRRQHRKQRDLSEAQRMVWALFGSFHYKLGMRYVRFCLRRWPRDPVLWNSYVRYGFRLGRMDEMASVLDDPQSGLPHALRLKLRHMQSGYLQDFEGAVEQFAQLRQENSLTTEIRDLQTMLTFNLCHPQKAEAVFAKTGPLREGDDRLLHRSGLPGMMALEFDLERQALAENSGDGSLEDWVRLRPGSSMAAIHLIDAWRTEGQTVDAKTSASEIPRQIYQYWDKKDIPEAIAPMTKSWASAPGFVHHVFNRAEGLEFLRNSLGMEWVRAFQLAENAAQEADLLRLCLLAYFGGVYADADDYLHGDLRTLLGEGRGLVLYRETLGGALGNNFIAVGPGHPVIVRAAEMARTALSQRSVELAWTKTGPGLLARAVADYIIAVGTEEAHRNVTIVDWGPFAQHVSTHIPALYKESSAYWGNAQNRRPETRVWDFLLAALRET